tara:strand:+ start:2314 stop:2601 length:288 start_codon:yes stop_codon:yes gene_type:complete
MTIQEIMERTGMTNTSMAIALIKDAFHLIQSNDDESRKVSYSNIIVSSDGDDNQYDLPSDLVTLRNISVKDTTDDKYKKIKRLALEVNVVEDTTP